MPFYSQTLRRSEKVKVERDESIARSGPEISVHVVRGVLRRKRPMKQMGFKFFVEWKTGGDEPKGDVAEE